MPNGALIFLYRYYGRSAASNNNGVTRIRYVRIDKRLVPHSNYNRSSIQVSNSLHPMRQSDRLHRYN